MVTLKDMHVINQCWLFLDFLTLRRRFDSYVSSRISFHFGFYLFSSFIFSFGTEKVTFFHNILIMM